MSKMCNVNKYCTALLSVLILLVALVGCSPQDNDLVYNDESYLEYSYANEQSDEMGAIVADNSTDDKYAPEPKNYNTNEPSDPDEIQEECDNVSINFTASANISDSVCLLFLLGLFPGESEYLCFDEISFYETAIMKFLSKSYSPVSFFEFNRYYQGKPMSINYTPVEFFEFSYQHVGRHTNVVFVANVNLKDFKFVEIHHIVCENQNYFFITDTLFSTDMLMANQPFVTSWLHQWHEPVRGISFVDAYDNTRVFTVIQNFIGGDVPPWHIVEINRFGELSSVNY